MAILPMLLQMIPAIAASVAAARDIALELEPAGVLLGVTAHVLTASECLGAHVAGPATSHAGAAGTIVRSHSAGGADGG